MMNDMMNLDVMDEIMEAEGSYDDILEDIFGEKEEVLPEESVDEVAEDSVEEDTVEEEVRNPEEPTDEEDVLMEEEADVDASSEEEDDEEDVPNKRVCRVVVRSTIPWSVTQIIKMLDKRTILVDDPIQRGFVWELKRKSYLMHSFICGYYVDPIKANQVEVEINGKKSKVYWVLDGKQRIEAMRGFLNDEYALVDQGVVVLDDGTEVDLDGKKFSELPEEIQENIKSYMMTVVYFNDLTDAEKAEVFRKINNGKPLSSKERNISYCADLSSITSLGEHEFFKATQTKSFLDKKNQLSLVMKIYEMLNKNVLGISFDSKDFNDTMKSITTTEDQRKEICEVLDKFLDAFKLLDAKADKETIKRIKKEVHLISLIPFVKKAIDEGISDELLADFFRDAYYANHCVSEEYESACASGTSKNVNIIKRNMALNKAWEKFFTVDAEEPVEGFRYGMRMRGYSIGCQPEEGFLAREDASAESNYYDILVYDRELTDEEVEQYELDRI